MAPGTDSENRTGLWGRRGLKALLAAGLAIVLSGCGGKPTAEWIQQLHGKEAAQRLHAVKALGERCAEADVVVPALAETLRDEDAFVRRDAAAALGKIGAGAKTAVPALLAAMQDRNAGVRQEAARALKRIDPEAGAKAGVR
jgi:HEAT repeat protein